MILDILYQKNKLDNEDGFTPEIFLIVKTKWYDIKYFYLI